MTDKILARDPIDEYQRAFRLFDEDNTGRISIRNLRHIARELGENITEEELQAMIDEFDTDGDGESTQSTLINILTLYSQSTGVYCHHG